MYALGNTNCHLSRLGGRSWSRSRGPRRQGRHPDRAAALWLNIERGCCRMIRVSVSLAPWTSISDQRETAEGWSVSSRISSRAFSNSSFKLPHKPPCTRRHCKSGSQYPHCPTAPHGFPGSCGSLEKAAQGNLRYLLQAWIEDHQQYIAGDRQVLDQGPLCFHEFYFSNIQKSTTAWTSSLPLHKFHFCAMCQNQRRDTLEKPIL